MLNALGRSSQWSFPFAREYPITQTSECQCKTCFAAYRRFVAKSQREEILHPKTLVWGPHRAQGAVARTGLKNLMVEVIGLLGTRAS